LIVRCQSLLSHLEEQKGVHAGGEDSSCLRQFCPSDHTIVRGGEDVVEAATVIDGFAQPLRCSVRLQFTHGT